MPGFLKVDGSQKPIAVPWLKESGTWKPVAIGYIKVDGTWRIWYTAEVVDDFNRADNSSLGTASDDFSEWTDYISGWEIQSNAAYVDPSTSSALSAIELYKATTDLTIETDLVDGLGIGLAWWVVDENNYWVAVPSRIEQERPAIKTCPTGFTLEGNQCKKVETYDATFVPSSSGGGYYTCSSSSHQLNDFNNTCYYLKSPTTSTTTKTFDRCVSGRKTCSRCYCNEWSASGGTFYGIKTFSEEVTTTSCGGCDGPYENGQCLCSYSATYVEPFTIPSYYTCPDGGTVDGNTCVVTTTEAADIVEPYLVSPSWFFIREIKNGNVEQVGEFLLDYSNITVEDYIKTQSNTATTPDAYSKETGLSSAQIRDAHQSAVPNDPKSIKLEIVGNNLNWKTYKTSQVQGTPYATGAYTLIGGANKKASVGISKFSVNPSELERTNQQGTKLDNFRAE